VRFVDPAEKRLIDWMTGFLHGAYYEGLDIGQTVADCVKSGDCPDLEHFLQVTNANPY